MNLAMDKELSDLLDFSAVSIINAVAYLRHFYVLLPSRSGQF